MHLSVFYLCTTKVKSGNFKYDTKLMFSHPLVKFIRFYCLLQSNFSSPIFIFIKSLSFKCLTSFYTLTAKNEELKRC